MSIKNLAESPKKAITPVINDDLDKKYKRLEKISLEFCLKYVHLYLPLIIYKAFKSEKPEFCSVSNKDVKEKIRLIFNNLGMNFTIREVNCFNPTKVYFEFYLQSKQLNEVKNINSSIQDEIDFINNELSKPFNKLILDIDIKGDFIKRGKLPAGNPMKIDNHLDKSNFISMEYLILNPNYINLSSNYKIIAKFLATQGLYKTSKYFDKFIKLERELTSSPNEAYLYSSILACIGVNSKINVKKRTTQPLNQADNSPKDRAYEINHYYCCFEIVNSKVSRLSKHTAYSNLLKTKLFTKSELDIILNNCLDLKNGKEYSDFVLEDFNINNGFEIIGLSGINIENPVPLSILDRIKKLL